MRVIEKSLDPLKLLEQAGMTADHYLSDAETYIDKRFGEGYAKKNPQLMGAFIQAAAQDFHTATMGKAFEYFMDTLEQYTRDRAGHEEFMRESQPDVGGEDAE